MNSAIFVRLAVAGLLILPFSSHALWAQKAASAPRSVQSGEGATPEPPARGDSQTRAEAFRGKTNDAGLANREKALQDLEVVIESAKRFDRTQTADFVVITEPRGIYTRIDLVPARPAQSAAKANGTVRFFLQGQEREKIEVPAGKYILRLAFWLPGQAFPVEYPKTAEVELSEGARATFTLSREALSAVRAWLKEIHERERKKRPKEEKE